MTSFLLWTSLLAAWTQTDRPDLVLIVGAVGDEQFAADFREAETAWREVASQSWGALYEVGAEGDQPQRERLIGLLDSLPATSSQPLWLILVGHGTFDGKRANFNLVGPDVSAEELQQWLSRYQRDVVVINGASASAPFLQTLSGPGRVIITATRSGFELNYARFGVYFARAIGNPESDLDKDGQTSLLEAYLRASTAVAEFYEREGRLASEHALLDDNGDGQGTPADWFQGVRPVRSPQGEASVDGRYAHRLHLVRSLEEQRLSSERRQRRDELEAQIYALRDEKSAWPEDEYYARLQALLLDLAKTYDE